MSEFYNEFLARIGAQKTAWLAAKARQAAEAPALVGFSHVVVDSDVMLALYQEGSRFTPKTIRPEGSPMTVWTRSTAEKIAAARGDGYQAIPYKELADRRLAALDQMLVALVGESAAITL